MSHNEPSSCDPEIIVSCTKFNKHSMAMRPKTKSQHRAWLRSYGCAFKKNNHINVCDDKLSMEKFAVIN